MSSFSATIRALVGAADQKALPDLRQPQPAIHQRGAYSRLTQPEAGRHLQAYGGYDAIDWVMDAVWAYSQPLSTAPFHFERDGKRMRQSDEPSDRGKHPGGLVPLGLENLLHRPNPHQDYGDLLELAPIDLLTVGNHYWFKYGSNESGQPAALYRLMPSWVTVIPGTRQLIDAYEYLVPGEPEPLVFRPEDIIHFKLPNPHSPYYGLGLISGGPRMLDIELNLVETQAQFFERGAKLSGVLQSDRSVPEPVFKKIQRQFASMYSGSSNAYQVAVLERGLSFSPIQNTAAEAQFVELTKLGRDRIFQLMGVHPSLVNGDSPRAGVLDEAQRYFDTKKLRPFFDRLERRISAELTQAWGIDFKIDYEYVMPEKDRLNLASTFAAVAGVKVREVREYLGLDPLGDERDEIVLNLPGITTAEDGIANREPGAQGGRPGNSENTAQFPSGAGQTLPSGAAAVTSPTPDARRRARRAADATKARPSVEEILALDPAAPDVLAVLEEGKALTKAQRPGLIDAVDALGWQPGDPRRAAVRGVLEEGVRRGYSIEQLVDGVDGEDFEGVRGLLL